MRLSFFYQNPAHILRVLPFLLALAHVSIVPMAGAVLPQGMAEFVIITNSDLEPEFESLAAFKRDIGITSRVVSLDWISAHTDAGVDLPATVRGFLQQAYAQWGTQYVLLGGNLELVPTRWVYSSFFPLNGGTDIPADLYFASLDGDWDADGDGIFAEPYVSTLDPGDDADLEPELAVGRAPVSTPAEAALFVEKTIAFHTQSGVIGLPRALLIADVLFPSLWQPGGYIIQDGATSSEDIRATLETADPPWLVDRSYENYTEFLGATNATSASVLEAMSTGEYRLVHHIAFVYGDSLAVGQGIVTGDQLAQLNNSDPFFFTVLGSRGAAHDATSTIVQALLAPHGGCAAGLGATRGAWAIQTHDYHKSFYELALATPDSRVGDALKETFAEFIEFTDLNNVYRWTQLTMVLLGDPTLPLSAAMLPVSIDDRDVDPEDHEVPISYLQARLSVAPNPFNPQLVIRGQLPVAGRVRLAVCDVRGREVRVLFNGTHEAGEASWTWNGQDDAGRSVASGVYLLRLETARSIVHQSVILAR